MKKGATIALLGLALLLLSWGALASGGGYKLGWWTTAGASGSSGDAAAGYSLWMAVGQPAAGQAMRGGGFTISPGTLPVAAEPAGFGVYLPLVVR